MNDYLKRTWACVNLDNLHYNISQIKNKLPKSTKIIAVVKANAYGHGDKFVARELLEMGIDFLAVSNLEEAISLSRAGINCGILILGYTPIESANLLAEYKITQTVFSAEYAKMLSEFCTKNNIHIDVHVKIDTGMGRIGFVENSSEHCLSEVIETCSLKNLNPKGIYSHLSSADNFDEESLEYTKAQEKSFNALTKSLSENGISFECVHLQNSAGIAFLEHKGYTHARAGIVMYGSQPGNRKLGFDIKPVMKLQTVVAMLKEIKTGTSISYGRKFVSEKKSKVATVPIGYGDGYHRLLSNKADMLINGKRAKLLGTVCMDQLVLDVSEIADIKLGDVVTVVGQDGDECILFEELAGQIGTISYELMCSVSKRVPRVYTKNGKTIAIENYILD